MPARPSALGPIFQVPDIPGVASMSISRTDLLPLVAVGLATLAAAATDLWKFKVYNILTFPMIAAGLVVSTFLGGWGGLASSLMGAGLGFGLLVVLCAMGGVGEGDVKLLTAVGAWLGPYLTYQVFVATALFGGAYAVSLVLIREGVMGLAVELIAARQALLSPGSWKRPESTIEAEVRRPDRRRRLVPFAAMTCLGFFATIAWWGRDLDRVWPPDDREIAASTAHTGSDREVAR
jgi:prepilin peptidase CpaA